LNPIKIISRLGEIDGFANEEVAYFDRYDSKAGKIIRHFIMLDENIKLMYEPWGWKEEWYADLINIEYVNNLEIKITDLYIDIIIEGNGPTYRMIDFEDVVKALVRNEIQAEQLEKPFKKLQEFLDSHLHKGKDFPPTAIRPFISEPKL
jgi:predicted RNA-binding protein associated with RNAse of E/G family